MAHTVKRLAPGFQALCEAVQISPLPILDASPTDAKKEIITVLGKIADLTDDAWAALPADAQALFDKAAEMTNNSKDPTSIVIEHVETASDTKAGKSNGKSALAKEEDSPAPKVERKVQSNETGETKAATETPKGRFGGGARKNPATDWARKYVLKHPDAAPADVLKVTLEQGFPQPISKGTVDSLVFEMRSALRTIKESGFVLTKA